MELRETCFIPPSGNPQKWKELILLNQVVKAHGFFNIAFHVPGLPLQANKLRYAMCERVACLLFSTNTHYKRVPE
eukprot:1893599-Amphidinium_carterae.2